jgi:hypothetical protein
MQDNRSGALVVLFMVVASRCLIRVVLRNALWAIDDKSQDDYLPSITAPSTDGGWHIKDVAAFTATHVTTMTIIRPKFFAAWALNKLLNHRSRTIG